MSELTHFDQEGNAIMVDVSNKEETTREAIAKGSITMNKETFQRVMNNTMKKGDVLNVARVAGIMASKQTATLIPMCHPLLISKCTVDFQSDVETSTIEVEAKVGIVGKTGVEMEALIACNVASLTIYDMCKAMDKQMMISNVYVQEKHGGKSGSHFYQGQ